MRSILAVTVLYMSALPVLAGDAAEKIVAPIEAAHQKDAYYAHAAVKADIDVDFGGGDLLAGTMWFTPWLGHVRMELDDGTVLVWDGERAWRSPSGGDDIPFGARFHLITWPYFMALPYKLNDPGVHHEYVAEAPITLNRAWPASKMTFDAGVGDAPDDWYLLFKDPEGDQLAAAAYIVTYGAPVEEANIKPSIVLYQDYETFDGVPFATTWTFHYWDREAGVDGEAKGVAKLSDIAFVTPPDGAFEKPADAVESLPPGAE